MDNIEKLREKVEKDPASTLFVPLAEEYRKVGQLDEAIVILKSGIDRQPGYMSARVSLGKIYLEKDMKKEAIMEFEMVTGAIPDNLFAQRKLADLYNELGKREMAISCYETVLSLNPLDEEAQEILEGLKAGKSETPGGDQPDEEAGRVEEDLAPGETFSGEDEDEYNVIGLDKPPDWSSALEVETSDGEAAEEAVAEVAEEPLDEENVGKVESVLKALSEPEGTEDTGSVETTEKTEIGLKNEISEAGHAEQAFEQVSSSFEEADQSIENGDYARAMEIYNSNLKINPNDAQVLQRVEELRALLKLLGREDELMESELNSFLEAVKARRDEFFGRT